MAEVPVCFMIAKGITFVGAAAHCVIDFVEVTEDKDMSKNKKIMCVACDVLAVVTAGGLLKATLAKASSSAIGWAKASAAADITQKIVHLSSKKGPLGYGDYLHLGAGIILRVFSLAEDVIIFKPEFFDPHKETVEKFANIAGIAGCLYENRETLIGAWGYVYRFVRRVSGHPVVVGAPTNGSGKPFINLAPEHAEPIYRLKRMQTISEIEEIPSLFYADDVLKQFCCALSGHPIRHMLVVSGTEERAQPIWFEAAAILQKIQEKERPPQWPEEILFARENLREFPSKQSQIDKALNDILEDIHNSDFRFEPFDHFENQEGAKFLQMMAILKAIGLERINTMQDAEICDVVSKKVSKDHVRQVVVKTKWVRFHEGAELKPTKVIQFEPTVTFLGKPPLSEKQLFCATRAALISKNEEDQKALKLAQRFFEIRISTDLKDFAVCSELVKPACERKEELLYMMKHILKLDQLHTLSDTELAERILVRMPKSTRVNVSVRSLVYQFPEAPSPKPARAIVFVPPKAATDKNPRSTNSLFAAARFIFGSQNEVDKQELKNSHTLILYVETNFNNIDIKEVLQT